MTKSNVGREGFISADIPHHSPLLRAETQGRNLVARTEAEASEKHCVLTCPSWLLSLLSYSIGTICPGAASLTGSWALTHQPSRQCPTDLPTARSYGGFSQLRSPPLKASILSCHPFLICTWDIVLILVYKTAYLPKSHRPQNPP